MAATVKRRDLLRAGYAVALTTTLAACAPQVVKETVVVEKEKVVEVEKEVTTIVKEEVEKEVTRVVEVEAPPGGFRVSGEPIKLEFVLRSAASQPMYDVRLEEFMAEYPQITVEYLQVAREEYMVKVQTMAAAGTLGDFMWTSLTWCDYQYLATKGLLLPMDDWLEANNQPLSQWIPAAVDAMRVDGKLYGIPSCSHPGHAFMYVNEDAFAAAGLEPPEIYNENTPQDILDWAPKLAQGPESDRQVWGYMPLMRNLESWLAVVRSFGALNYDAEGLASLHDSDEWWEWVQWMQALYNGKLAPYANQFPIQGEGPFFSAGKAAMLNGARHLYASITNTLDELGSEMNWRVVRQPKFANARGWPAGIDAQCPIASTKHPYEACLLAYTFGDRRASLQMYLGTQRMSARVDDGEQFVKMSGNAFVKLSYDLQMEEEQIYHPKNLREREVENYLLNAWTNIWPGTGEVSREYLEEVRAGVQAILDKPMA